MRANRYELAIALAAKLEDDGISPDQDWDNETTSWKTPEYTLKLSGDDVWFENAS